MRTKILSVLFLAGTVAACGSNPPPPPPMAETAPMPAPAPMAAGPMAGRYRGTAELAADAPARCARNTRPVTVTVARNNSFTLAGVRGTIGADGAISSSSRRGGSMTGTASATGLDINAMRGRCSYHYSLTKA